MTKKAAVTLFLAGAFSIAAAMLVPALLGYERYVVTGASMSGTIDRGSIVYEKPVPTSRLRVGDVITYTAPPAAGPQTRLTHRIVWIGRDARGRRSFRTKGDASTAADPWRFSLDGPTQARAEFHLPYIGYAFMALGVRAVRVVVIGVPALLIAMAVLISLWREAGEVARRDAAGESTGQPA